MVIPEPTEFPGGLVLGRVFAGWYLFASLLLIFSGLMLRQTH